MTTLPTVNTEASIKATFSLCRGLPSCIGSFRPMGGAVTGSEALVVRVSGELLGQDGG